MKKTVLNEYVYEFSFDYNSIDTSNIINIHKYLMKNHDIKLCLEFFQKMFTGLLTSLVNASNHTNCASLSNQKYEIQPAFINSHPNEYSQEFYYYLLIVKSDKCVGSCSTLNGLPNKVCVPNKTVDLNLSVFNMITGINEWKTLKKHISCECNCKFDERKCNPNQWWNNDKC